MSEPENVSEAVVQQEETSPAVEEPPPTVEELPAQTTENPAESPAEPPPPTPPPVQEEAPADVASPTIPDDPGVQHATEAIQLPPMKPEIIDKSPDDTSETKQTPRRRSSIKRASTDAPAKSMSINQETFMPPEASTPSPGSADRRVSSMKRASLASGDAKRPSTARKSRYGMLTSKARMVLGSIVDIKSNTIEGFDKKVARYQNTYKLESEKPFNPEKVDKILKEVIQEVLENLQYDPEKCASTAKHASTQIRSKVKQLEFDRYKVVCIVSIGEKNSQDVYATCRFLWDPEKDRYSFYSMENTHVYAIAFCFGLYYE